MYRLLTGILFVLIFGALIIGILLRPSNAGYGYWLSILWVIFLLSINWYTSAAIFTGSKDSRDGIPGSLLGSLPGISIGILAYSFLSIVFLVLNRFNILGDTWHLVFQIIFAMVVVTVTLTSIVAAKAARAGSGALVTQHDLLTSLKNLRRNIENDLDRLQLDEVTNYVAYKMPHTSKLDGVELQKILDVLNNLSIDNSKRVEVAKKILSI